MPQIIVDAILKAWDQTCCHIASGHAHQFAGRRKEGLVLGHLGRILTTSPDVNAATEVGFERWTIDLVGSRDEMKVAVEGKYKILSDGAVPDNRKAAFFDIYKLEQCVDRGGYSGGMFIWLTNQRDYLRPANGDSADFSTHEGCVYQAGTALRAQRARNAMPLPFTLSRSYKFAWKRILDTDWHTLIIDVRPTT